MRLSDATKTREHAREAAGKQAASHNLSRKTILSNFQVQQPTANHQWQPLTVLADQSRLKINHLPRNVKVNRSLLLYILSAQHFSRRLIPPTVFLLDLENKIYFEFGGIEQYFAEWTVIK